MSAIIPPSGTTSRFSLCDEMGGRTQGAGRLSEVQERRFRIGDELGQALARGIDAEHRDEGSLVRRGILVRRLTDDLWIAFQIEKIVGDLESLADRVAVAFERGALRCRRLAEDRAGAAGEAQQSAGLHCLQRADLLEAEGGRRAGKTSFGK